MNEKTFEARKINLVNAPKPAEHLHITWSFNKVQKGRSRKTRSKKHLKRINVQPNAASTYKKHEGSNEVINNRFVLNQHEGCPINARRKGAPTTVSTTTAKLKIQKTENIKILRLLLYLC